MEASTLIADFEARGVAFSLRDGRIHFQARADQLGRADIESLRSRRDELEQYLISREAEFSELRRRFEAEDLWLPTTTQTTIATSPHAHHIQLTFQLPRDLDAVALQAAIDRVIVRHAALRTSYFRTSECRLLAVTRRQVRCPIETIDLSDTPAQSWEQAARARAVEIVHRQFDLETGPLFRFVLMEGAEKGPVLLFVVHHSICDAASTIVLFDELAAIYAAERVGSEPRLSPATAQFPQFAREKNEWLRGERYREHLAFWRENLCAQPTAFSLPRDRPKHTADDEFTPPIENGVGSRIAQRIRSLAGAERTTSFIWTLAAFCLQLARWGGSEEVRVWVLHAGRTEAKHGRTVGLLADRWLLQVRLPKQRSFVETVRIVRDAYARALPHIRVTAASIRPILDERSGGRSGPSILFNFVSGLAAQGRADSTDSSFRRLHWPVRTGRLNADSEYALNCGFFEGEFGIRWTIQHQPLLFHDATVQKNSEELADLLFGSTESSG